ncbi:unnamed protein product [Dimorphilus gyrociliatus]|uniref:Uncharacterized protein n=1 Tax=Dimorphilus gyrociliatus TaxID=2664684 RepID=A0A7I8VR23_9ANNE|nr:unnamed protein product [Dimorphilus gyrociliatus]
MNDTLVREKKTGLKERRFGTVDGEGRKLDKFLKKGENAIGKTSSFILGKNDVNIFLFVVLSTAKGIILSSDLANEGCTNMYEFAGKPKS